MLASAASMTLSNTQTFEANPMQTVTLEEAQAHLPELLPVLEPGEELTIVAGGQELAQVRKVIPETDGHILDRIAAKTRRTPEGIKSVRRPMREEEGRTR